MDAAQAQMLAEHNKFRAEVGVPPLFWSNPLAAKAQSWAEHLASEAHQLEHSHMPGLGENLAFWTSGRRTPVQLIDDWAEEKNNFTAGDFPDVARTSEWRTVSHYTQMIWRDSAQVGCALASGGNLDYLVCEYSPQGNIVGQKVY